MTFPACAHTIIGPRPSSAAGSADVSIAPSGAGTTTIRNSPIPSSRAARSMVAWRSAPTTTRMRGARCNPSRPTSQPASCRRASGPPRPTVLAPWPPVVKPTEAEAGKPEELFEPSPATSSNAMAAGDIASLNALVPAGRDDRCDQRGIERSARHEPVIARPGGRHEARGRSFEQLVEDVFERRGIVGKEAERVPDGAPAGARPSSGLRQRRR